MFRCEIYLLIYCLIAKNVYIVMLNYIQLTTITFVKMNFYFLFLVHTSIDLLDTFHFSYIVFLNIFFIVEQFLIF